jgi:hypothetical protein
MGTENTNLKPLSGVLAPNLPTLFADGVANLVNTNEIVKMVLFRTDGDISDQSKFENVGVGQIVMTMSGFANTLAFFEKAQKTFLTTGVLTEEKMQAARKAIGLEQ